VFSLVGCAISLLASRVEHARAQTEELARALRASEQETVRRMDEFLGVASHEMKTPLTSLLANIQMARHRVRARETARDTAEGAALESGGAQLTTLLDGAERQARRQDRLINDLLDMSRARADKLQLDLDEHDLLTIVRDAVEEQRRAHPTRQIDVR